MAIQQILENINAGILRKDVPIMDVGDTIDVHCKIVEGDKERIQVFSGVLIARSGRGINEMITVRRVVEETGVERVFPVHSPRVAFYEVKRRGNARRAKLYYLRDRAGKSRRVTDRRRGMKRVADAPTTSTPYEVTKVKDEKKK
ncbi:MAG: 50S ribosomal protein L19 [Phycisphaerales bacterium]